VSQYRPLLPEADITTLDEPTGASASVAGPSAEHFAERLLGAVLGALVQAAYLGDRLGHYSALASGGDLTSAELAGRTGTAERYAHEWLEHQAVTGVVTVDDPGAAAQERRYTLPAGPAEVLNVADSPSHVLPIARMGGRPRPAPRPTPHRLPHRRRGVLGDAR
jgi:hypothetical protein